MRLATLDQVRQEVKAASSDVSGHDYLLATLPWVTDRIERACGRWFVPRRATRSFDAPPGYCLDVDQDLLSITTLTNGDGMTISTANLVYLPRNSTPYWRVQIKPSAGVTFTYTTDQEQAVSILGDWGYHEDYANAWLLSGDTVQDNPLTSGATTLTVGSIVGLDTWGVSPRFSPGQLLKIESEWLAVIDADWALNKLTVQRGALGTTAASHAQNAPISSYYPQADINRAAVLWAAYLYKHRGSFEQTTYDGLGTTTWPKDAPGEVETIIERYRKRELFLL